MEHAYPPAFPLNPYQVEFLRDFNYHNFPSVKLIDHGRSGWLCGERPALYDFAEMLDDERIAYSEIGLVRRLVDGIKEWGGSSNS